MTESALRFDPEGVCRLSGTLSLETAPALWEQVQRQEGMVSPLVFDLSEVTRANSAALALLLEFLAWGQERGLEVRFRALPDSLLALARLSNAEGLLRKENS